MDSTFQISTSHSFADWSYCQRHSAIVSVAVSVFVSVSLIVAVCGHFQNYLRRNKDTLHHRSVIQRPERATYPQVQSPYRDTLGTPIQLRCPMMHSIHNH